MIRRHHIELIGNTALLHAVDKNRFLSNEVGLPTIEDILSELEEPGRDPRESFQYDTFSEDIQEITDLEPGLVLEGVVTNVTNFGAFVDIGVHQDGLVHISEMADRFIRDSHEEAKVGQIVKEKNGGADRDRTGDLLTASQALSQLSYSPTRVVLSY